MSEWLSFAASFAIVLSLLAALLFLLKKMQSGNLLGMSARKIRILETFSTGPRQKLVLLRVKDQDILVGITIQTMTTLATFPVSDEDRESDAAPADTAGDAAAASLGPLAPLATRFSELLKSATTGNQKKDGS